MMRFSVIFARARGESDDKGVSFFGVVEWMTIKMWPGKFKLSNGVGSSHLFKSHALLYNSICDEKVAEIWAKTNYKLKSSSFFLQRIKLPDWCVQSGKIAKLANKIEMKKSVAGRIIIEMKSCLHKDSIKVYAEIDF